MKSMKNNIAKAASIIMLTMSVIVIGPEHGMAKEGKQSTARTSTRRSYNQSETLSSNMQRSSGRGSLGSTKRTQDASFKIPGKIEYPNFIEPTSVETPNVISSLGQKYTMIRRSRR